MSLDFGVWEGCEGLVTVVKLLLWRLKAVLSMFETMLDNCDEAWRRVSQHHDWHNYRGVKRLPHRHATPVTEKANVAISWLQLVE
jgi:hypothetical protein